MIINTNSSIIVVHFLWNMNGIYIYTMGYIYIQFSFLIVVDFWWDFILPHDDDKNNDDKNNDDDNNDDDNNDDDNNNDDDKNSYGLMCFLMDM